MSDEEMATPVEGEEETPATPVEGETSTEPTDPMMDPKPAAEGEEEETEEAAPEA